MSVEQLSGEASLFGEPVIQDPDDSRWAININKKITSYGIGLTSIIGFILNCLVVWVWSMKSDFNPLVFFFKLLAVFDNIYIVSFNVWYYTHVDSTAAFIMGTLAFGSQYMVVNTTLLLTLCRWLVVFRPVSSRPYLSCFWVRLAVIIMVVTCTVSKVAERIVSVTHPKTRLRLYLGVTLSNIFLTLPILVESLLTISLAWMSYHNFMLCRRLTNDDLTAAVGFDSEGNDSKRRQHNASKLTRARRLTLAIITLNIGSLIAYPIGVVILGYLKITSFRATQISNKRIIFAVVNLLHIINSSMNFIVYMVFIKNFRQLFRLRMVSFSTENYISLASKLVEDPSDTMNFHKQDSTPRQPSEEHARSREESQGGPSEKAEAGGKQTETVPALSPDVVSSESARADLEYQECGSPTDARREARKVSLMVQRET